MDSRSAMQNPAKSPSLRLRWQLLHSTIYYIFCTNFKAFLNPLRSLKPYQFHLARVINKCGDKSFSTFLFDGCDVDDFANELDFSCVVIELIDFMVTRPIDVTVRIKIDQILICPDRPGSSGASGDRWVVDVVPRFWIECRRGPGDTLPTTPTGTCQYR